MTNPNPIREWNKQNSMTAPSYKTVEQWAALVDKLLNPWISVDERLPKWGIEILFVYEGLVKQGTYDRPNNIFICGKSYWTPEEVTCWMEIPPPAKGG